MNELSEKNQSKVKLISETLMGRMKIVKKEQSFEYELERLSLLLHSSMYQVSQQHEVMSMIDGRDMAVKLYVNENEPGTEDTFVPGEPLPSNWEMFKYLFFTEEIRSYVSLMSPKRKAYFFKETRGAAGPVVGGRVTSLMSMFNVEALALLYAYPQSTHTPVVFPCACVYNLSEMPAASVHRCSFCGGLSEKDESMAKLDNPTKKFLYERRYRFLDNSSILIEHEGKFYVQKVRNYEEITSFCSDVRGGQIKPVSIQVEEHPTHVVIVDAQPDHKIVSDQIHKKVQEMDNVVFCRASYRSGVIEEMVTYEPGTGYFRRVFSHVNHLDVFRAGALVLDPDGYKYRNLINGCPYGGKLLPKFNGLEGFCYWGNAYQGIAEMQLSQEIKRVYGYALPEFGHAQGVYHRDYPEQLVSVFVSLKEVRFVNGEKICEVCSKVLTMNNTFVVGPWKQVDQTRAKALGYCKECATIVKSWDNCQFKQVYAMLNLTELTNVDVKMENRLFWVENYPLATRVDKSPPYPKKEYTTKVLAVGACLCFQLRVLSDAVHYGDLSRKFSPLVVKRLEFLRFHRIAKEFLNGKTERRYHELMKGYWTVGRDYMHTKFLRDGEKIVSFDQATEESMVYKIFLSQYLGKHLDANVSYMEFLARYVSPYVETYKGIVADAYHNFVMDLEGIVAVSTIKEGEGLNARLLGIDPNLYPMMRHRRRGFELIVNREGGELEDDEVVDFSHDLG